MSHLQSYKVQGDDSSRKILDKENYDVASISRYLVARKIIFLRCKRKLTGDVGVAHSCRKHHGKFIKTHVLKCV